MPKAKKLKTGYWHLPLDKYGVHDVVQCVGRGTGRVNCPFCGNTLLVYIWSFSGGGKKCECGAVLSFQGALMTDDVYKKFTKAEV